MGRVGEGRRLFPVVVLGRFALEMSDSKKRVLRALTLVQHGTASFIGVFLAVHLAAPASAFFGGSATSSQVMVGLKVH